MKQIFFLICFVAMASVVVAQKTAQQLAKAFQQFASDPQMKNAQVSLYVLNAKNGEVIFDKNSRLLLAPASTLKIISSVTAYELLGKNFRFSTAFLYAPNSNSLIVSGSGDPTLGSPRYAQTTPDVILDMVQKGLKAKSAISNILLHDLLYEDASIPAGYPWEDIGNYYGAGHGQLNWRENQYTLYFKTGRQGAPSTIGGVKPAMPGIKFKNLVKAGAAGSGDNAYIYFTSSPDSILIKGTVPPQQSSFDVSGAMPNPPYQFAKELQSFLTKTKNTNGSSRILVAKKDDNYAERLLRPPYDTIYIHYSPSLDSIVYWLNRKSINLYAEALIKSIAAQKEKSPSLEKGIRALQLFWSGKGIGPGELKMVDGSGLSPANRISTYAQVSILQHAKKQPWFGGFYQSLPEYNGMKMKSGTINGVKGFAGYHTSKAGEEYVFSFIVNNFGGSSSTVVQKMYRVLNELK